MLSKTYITTIREILADFSQKRLKILIPIKMYCQEESFQVNPFNLKLNILIFDTNIIDKPKEIIM